MSPFHSPIVCWSVLVKKGKRSQLRQDLSKTAILVVSLCTELNPDKVLLPLSGETFAVSDVGQD
jgi:hypothetical protein